MDSRKVGVHMGKYIGKLWLESPFIHLDIDEINFHLFFRVADKMDKIIRIKEQDHGYLVIDANFKGIGIEEDYIDIRSILHELNISPKNTINLMKKVVLK